MVLLANTDEKAHLWHVTLKEHLDFLNDVYCLRTAHFAETLILL
jgi:hypothetical protein